MKYAGLVARILVKRSACVFLFGKPEEN